MSVYMQKVELRSTICVFFHLCVMLQLVGNYYTLPRTSGSSLVDTVQEEASPENSEPERWCYCGGEEEGEMICCDDERCKIQWYHFDCIGISEAPRGTWYCPKCIKASPKRVAKIPRSE